MKFGKRPKAERLNDYQIEVDRARKFRKSEGYDALWQRLRDMYTGAGRTAEMAPDEDSIFVNMAFSTINVIYPSVSAGIPQISILANDPMKADAALVVQDIMNFAWKHWEVQPAFRAAAKDFLMFGHGWAKVGWRYVETQELLTEDDMMEEFIQRRQEAIDAGTQDPSIMGDLPTDEEIARNLVTTTTSVLEDRPFVEQVSILDMFVNPEATTMDDIRWVAQRVMRNVEEVQADENYVKAARKRVKGTHTSYDSTDPRRRAEDHSDGPDMVELWEFYDVVDKVMAVFATDGDEFLVEPGEMPYHFGHPFVMIRNYEIPDVFYPIGDLEMLYPLQEELNKTRSDMLNFRAAYARKYLARKSAFANGDEAKLASRKDGEIIWIENDSIPLSDIVERMPINDLDANLFNWSGQIVGDIQEVSGVSEYARGGGGGARTATEASLIQDALNARSGEKLALVEKMATDVARKLLKIMQQFLTRDEIARVTGPAGEQQWLIYDRESIQGEYDFTVEAGSTQPNNETFRRQKAIAMANTLLPFIQMGVVNAQELAKHLLQEGFAIRSPEKFLINPPPMIDPNTGQPLPPGMAPPAGAPAGGPGQAPMNGSIGAPGGEGMDAPQMDPNALNQAQQEAAQDESAVPGVPAGMMAQLQNQFGVNPGV